jgi:hypothetical protein
VGGGVLARDCRQRHFRTFGTRNVVGFVHARDAAVIIFSVSGLSLSCCHSRRR